MQLFSEEILFSLLHNFPKDSFSYIICWSAVLLLLSCYWQSWKQNESRKSLPCLPYCASFLQAEIWAKLKLPIHAKYIYFGCWINFLLFPKQILLSSSSDECVRPWIISIYHQANSISSIFWVRKHPVMPQGTVMCSESSWDTQVVHSRWHWACVLGRAAWHLL